MRIVGIIAEYNPFHAGHAFQLEKAKKETGADAAVVILSGSFVQRGEPAVYPCSHRVLAALRGGADVVLAMPAAFSTAAAPDFARFGVVLADAMGIDALAFGSESGNIRALSEVASLLADEPPRYGEKLRDAMSAGLSFPAARELALSSLCPEHSAEIHGLLSSPNNLLGIEYLAACRRIRSPMACVTIRREGGGYHGSGSAEDIRKMLAKAASPDEVLKNLAESGAVPAGAAACFSGIPPLFPDDFSALLSYAVLREKSPETVDGLGHGLGFRLRGLPAAYRSFADTAAALKTRNVTYTAVSRGLIRLLLGIRKRDMDWYRKALVKPAPGVPREQEKSCLYAEVLGFRREMSPVIRELRERSAVPFLTKKADAATLLPPAALALFQSDIDARHLYGIAGAMKGIPFRNAWTEGPVIV